MAQYIQSRENENIKYVSRLFKSPAFRAQEGLFAAEGVKLCRDLAEVQKPKYVFYTEKVYEEYPFAAYAESVCEKSFKVTESVMQRLSDVQTPQGICCVFDMPENTAPESEYQRLLALDCVQDPANVGAAIRSAAAFGWDCVILGPGCADAYSPKALRAGMSSTLKIPVIKTDNLPKTLERLSENGTICAAARLEESESIEDTKFGGALCLVIGSEGRGVGAETAAVCRKSVRIPISPRMESLNAAVAAGVLMWHYRKK